MIHIIYTYGWQVNNTHSCSLLDKYKIKYNIDIGSYLKLK